MSHLPFPMVALIDGACMGGGTELALTMDERLVSTAPHTQISLPEVSARALAGLGRHPAAAAVDRYERRNRDGVLERDDQAAESRRPRFRLRRCAARELARGRPPADRYLASKRRMERAARAAREQPIGLNPDQYHFAFAVAEGAIKGKTKGQYPAPLVALKAIRDGCNLPLEEGLKVEQKAFQELQGSPIMANLIAIFFMKNRLARDPGLSDPAVAPSPVKRVGVPGRADGLGHRGRARPLGNSAPRWSTSTTPVCKTA